MTDASPMPSERYAAGVARGEWQDDPAQRAMLAEFDRLQRELAVPEDTGLFAKLRAKLAEPTAVPGLYLWGGVGRGKTFLVDLFFITLPIAKKRRVHFHRFMREVQAALREVEGREDPLKDVAAALAADARVLCLDEFFVSDIGDAMILGNLLQHLFARGVTLVTTSNTAPVNLYRDGLQRERFLPAIALLQKHCHVVEMVSAQDWRLRALRQARTYHTPPGAEAERALAATFQQITRGNARSEQVIQIHGRPIAAKRLGEDAIWFDFDAVCDGPRAVADYIEIGRTWGTVLISNVPQFTPGSDDAARRFVELVDEFYDRRVKLVLSAATPIVELYDGERLRMEFARTQSRLIEMGSEAYLAQEHLL